MYPEIPPENLQSPKELRASFGITEEKDGFDENVGDKNDAKEVLDFSKDRDLVKEDTVMNESEAESGEKEEFTKDRFLDLVADARIPNSEYNKGGESKTKRDAAIKQLKDEDINVDYIRCSDIRGDDKSAKDKRSERNEEIDRLISSIEKGEVTEADKEILLSESIKLTEERLDEWKVEVVEEKEKELTDEEKREELIKNNEDLYRTLFFADFDNLTFEVNKDELTEFYLAFKEQVDEIVSQRKSRFRDTQELFEELQRLYLEHVFGVNTMDELRASKENLDKTIASSKSADQSVRVIAENLLRSQRPGLESKIKGKTMGVGSSRGWSSVDSALAGDYMLNYFEMKDINDGSDYSVVVKNLKLRYLQGRQIGGSMDVDLAKEPKSELMKQMIQIHDLCVEMDAATFKSVENLRWELTQKVDESLIAMLSIEKRGVAVVPKIMEEYDFVMRTIYNNTREAVNIDDKIVEDRVRNLLNTTHIFDSEDELNLFLRMGKDVCKLTAIDAQYGYPFDVQYGDKRGIPSSVRGAFFRGVFNFNKSLIADNKNGDLQIAQLNSGIDLGVIPFWNKQRKDEPAEKMVDSAPLTVAKINEIVNNKLAGNANFEKWIGTMKGYAEAKKAESDFMTNSPTLNTFVEKVVPAYLGYLQFTPDKGRGYLQSRLVECLEYFKSQRGGTDISRAAIYKTFLPENIFDGKGIFTDIDEMKRFFDFHGVVISERDVKSKEKDDLVREAGAKGDWVGMFKVGFGIKKRD